MKTVRPLLFALSIPAVLGLSATRAEAQLRGPFTPEVARLEVAGTTLNVVADETFESARLRVAGPRGYEAVALSQGAPLVLDLIGDGRVFSRELGAVTKVGQLVDGRYAWEARFRMSDGSDRTTHGALFVQDGSLVGGLPSRRTEHSMARRTAVGETTARIRSASPVDFEESLSAYKTVQVYDVGSPLGQTWLALYASTAPAYGGDSWGIENHDGSINFFELDSPAVHQDRFTFTPDGRMGIGTTAPAATLHLAGGAIAFNDPPLWTLFADIFGFDVAVGGGYPFHISPSTPNATLDLSGAGVGIGTQSPQAKLHVKGGAIVEGDVALGSSRSIKHEIEALDPAQALAGIRDLPLFTWVYREDPAQAKHLGPMAEDFHAAFRVGRDDQHISPTDSAGLALAGVQGVDRAVADLRTVVEAMGARSDRLAAENRELRERLENVERLLSSRD